MFVGDRTPRIDQGMPQGFGRRFAPTPNQGSRTVEVKTAPAGAVSPLCGSRASVIHTCCFELVLNDFPARAPVTALSINTFFFFCFISFRVCIRPKFKNALLAPAERAFLLHAKHNRGTNAQKEKAFLSPIACPKAGLISRHRPWQTGASARAFRKGRREIFTRSCFPIAGVTTPFQGRCDPRP